MWPHLIVTHPPSLSLSSSSSSLHLVAAALLSAAAALLRRRRHRRALPSRPQEGCVLPPPAWDRQRPLPRAHRSKATPTIQRPRGDGGKEGWVCSSLNPHAPQPNSSPGDDSEECSGLDLRRRASGWRGERRRRRGGKEIGGGGEAVGGRVGCEENGGGGEAAVDGRVATRRTAEEVRRQTGGWAARRTAEEARWRMGEWTARRTMEQASASSSLTVLATSTPSPPLLSLAAAAPSPAPTWTSSPPSRHSSLVFLGFDADSARPNHTPLLPGPLCPLVHPQVQRRKVATAEVIVTRRKRWRKRPRVLQVQ